MAAQGALLAADGRIAEAVEYYRRALVLDPDQLIAHANLGIALIEQGRAGEAMPHLERAVALQPNHPDVHNNLGVALLAQGRVAEAISAYEQALARQSDHANAQGNLGTALAEQGRTSEAVPHLERGIALNPNHADALNTLGNIAKHEGRFTEALAYYDRAIAIRPDYGQAHLNRSEIKRFRPGDPEIASLEALAVHPGLAAVKALNIQFALGKALEDCGEYARAFEHFRQGNVLKRAQIEYDEAVELAVFRQTAERFGRDLLGQRHPAADPSCVPIFVLGMPRSGSTLVEQILASHPQIYGAGELTDFGAAIKAHPEAIGPDYLARLPALPGGKTRLVDKLPGNYLNIGLIRWHLPNAKIIHTTRDPIDTCLSCYSKLFTYGHHYTYDLRELARTYGAYAELMAHWRAALPPGTMLEVSYEEVVEDLEGQARRLIEYCGLPWDNRCVDFHQAARTVKTASSVQVRQPLFRTSLQRWRRYEKELAPLIEELVTSMGSAVRLGIP